MAVPERSPPPPSGTTNVSRSGRSSSISSATVPAPAMTSRWLYAEHECRARAANVIGDRRFGRVVRGRGDDLGAQPSERDALCIRRGLRQMDARLQPQVARRCGDRESVIARRGRGDIDNRRPFILQASKRVGRAADLERSRRLDDFEFQPDLSARDIRQPRRQYERRPPREAVDTPGRGADVVQGRRD